MESFIRTLIFLLIHGFATKADWEMDVADHNPLHARNMFEMIYMEGGETLRIASVETRTMDGTLLGLSATPNQFQQLGMGQKFRGFRSKMEFAHEYVANISSKNPDQLILLVDSDVFIAKSCGVSKILEKYHNIVEKSGGKKIVFGAELNMFDCDRLDEIPGVPPYISAEKPQLVDMKKLKNIADRAYDQKGFVNMNSGTIMGPAAMLAEMSLAAYNGYMNLFSGDGWKDRLTAYTSSHSNHRKPTDQHFYWNYYLDNQDKVTVDFGQELFNVMSFVDVSKVWEVTAEGKLHNTFVDEEVCIAHFPGHSKYKYWKLIESSMAQLKKNA